MPRWHGVVFHVFLKGNDIHAISHWLVIRTSFKEIFIKGNIIDIDLLCSHAVIFISAPSPKTYLFASGAPTQ